MTTDEAVRLLIYGSIGLYITVAVIRLFRGRATAAMATLAVWALAFVAAVTGYSYRDELGGVANRVMATVVPGLPVETGRGQVTVIRSVGGEFVVKATSGGQHLTFIFDTGASSVVLRAEDAVRLGIDTRHLRYDVMVSTANGRAMTSEATLPDLSIGSVHESDVPVLVAKPGALQQNLLGMTFLDRLASFSVAQNKLVLQAR